MKKGMNYRKLWKEKPQTKKHSMNLSTGDLYQNGNARVILPEAMIAEIEHQANEGRSIGFTALEEGEKYIENGFPEEKLYKLLEERKKCSMDEIKNYLKEDYRIAIANMAKLGIKPSSGEMSYSGKIYIDIMGNRPMPADRQTL